MLFLLFKLLTVLVFLIAFLRRPTLVWGIGLLAVTAAVLLDTILGTFGREEMITRIGFFFYVISGFIFSGAALWLWGLLRPKIDAATAVTAPTATTPPVQPQPAAPPVPHALTTNSESAVDYNMLFQEIKKRFSREDVLDLMFDLGLDESEVMPVNQDMSRLIVNMIDRVAERGQGTALALGVERILTPPAPEKLPRLEKLTAESPPTILRQYLLAHFDLQQLQEAAATLNIDWENLSGSHKPAKARELLHYLQRRNRLDELINWLHQSA